MFLKSTKDNEHQQHIVPEEVSQIWPQADGLAQRAAKAEDDSGYLPENHGPRSNSFSSVTEDSQGS